MLRIYLVFLKFTDQMENRGEYGKESFYKNQELYKLLVISFILMNSMFDSGVIL